MIPGVKKSVLCNQCKKFSVNDIPVLQDGTVGRVLSSCSKPDMFLIIETGCALEQPVGRSFLGFSGLEQEDKTLPTVPPRSTGYRLMKTLITQELQDDFFTPVCLMKLILSILQNERAVEIKLQTNKMLPQTEESSPDKKEILLNHPPTKPLRRKFHPESQVLENHDLSSASSVTSSAASLKSHPAVQKLPSKQKKAIQTAIRKNKEANAVLARLNSELQQQLKEVHQERIALETQLEQLRPLSVL
ncbi:unnamed protein product [Ranitomeya imitator]|uniref:Uncharacterized protein n=1 Tax=Ranitomeya imitator TaxID=111125 RepID=A0ABN9LLG1_9NEOB|nr:unnamed protein product [Ranitomeya imitator]